LSKQTGDGVYAENFVKAADWLVGNLKPNKFGLPVWHHEFDWPYRELLMAPWYSGLAQGQGISLLVRASVVSGQDRYGEAASAAFLALTKDIKEGGVTTVDRDRFFWIEEYLVDPPSHILNGFIWALWGVLDYARWREDVDARRLFERSVATIKKNLANYDTGYWSLYELPPGKVSMVASPYYHHLHITQLRVMCKLTDEPVFLEYAERWGNYANNRSFRRKALLQKVRFKLTSY
jgi:heparosan-N-sulfate-glucuronate 5-epimerase